MSAPSRYFFLHLLTLVGLATSLVTAAEQPANKSLPGVAHLGTHRPGHDIFTQQHLPRLRIEIPPEGMEELRKYHWDSEESAAPRVDVRAVVREGDQVFTNVALHLKGSAGSFRPIDGPKPSFTLNFDKFTRGQKFHGLEKLHLNNSVQDPSYLSELISRELFVAGGIPAPRAGHALVSVNGATEQLYVLVEGWNKQFLKAHFPDDKGNLYDGGAAHDITHPLVLQSGNDPSTRHLLVALAEAATNRAHTVSTLLDVDQFLTFTALEVLMLHWDGYALNRNNYRVYHHRPENRLVFLAHGMDQMFGVWRSTPTSPITPMMKGVVAKAVIQTPDGRQRYLAAMRRLVDTVFADVPSITNRVLKLSAALGSAFGENHNARQSQQRAASALADRISRRLQSVREQLPTAHQPLRFDASGEAVIDNWRASRDSGNPSMGRNSAQTNILQIRASGSKAYGSWRSLVLLEPGTYQFTGQVRLDNFEAGGSVTNGGLTLRVSGHRNPPMLTNAITWTNFTYDFVVDGLADVELVCEFRGMRGIASFDADSLRLRRKASR